MDTGMGMGLPMDAKETARRLFEAAVKRASKQGVRLGQGADAEIQRFARNAAELLFNEPDRFDEARVSFERLVDAMVVAAQELPGYAKAHPGVIGEETLGRAMSKLCPLFPIC
jgi:hypothetical protein